MLEDDDIEFEGQESEETDYLIDRIKNDEKSIVYGLYSQLFALENFYSRIQTSYKRVCITWLVAFFFGVGYLLSQEGNNLPLNPLLVIIFLAIATMWGILLLWFVDIVIYQTSFFGVVLEEANMEKKYLWMPSVNLNTIAMMCRKSTSISQSFLYIFFEWLLLFIIFMATIFLLRSHVFCIVVASIVFVFLGWLIFFIMLKVEHPNRSPIKKQAIKKKLDVPKNDPMP